VEIKEGPPRSGIKGGWKNVTSFAWQSLFKYFVTNNNNNNNNFLHLKLMSHHTSSNQSSSSVASSEGNGLFPVLNADNINDIKAPMVCNIL
jgi:hypothetical protein